MPDMHRDVPPQTAAELPRRPDWQHRVVLVVVGLLAAVGGWLLAAAFLPRWWAHRVGAIVGDSFTTGIVFGLFCGILFTLLPLLVLRRVVRRHRPARSRVLLLVLAIVLGVPNLLTLWIVVGRSKAAHAGERTLDVDGTGFRGATAAGAIVGAALFLALAFVLRSRRRMRAEQQNLRTERGQLRDELDRYKSGGPADDAGRS